MYVMTYIRGGFECFRCLMIYLEVHDEVEIAIRKLTGTYEEPYRFLDYYFVYPPHFLDHHTTSLPPPLSFLTTILYRGAVNLMARSGQELLSGIHGAGANRGHHASPQSELSVGCKLCSSSKELHGLSVRAQARRIGTIPPIFVAGVPGFCLPDQNGADLGCCHRSGRAS